MTVDRLLAIYDTNKSNPEILQAQYYKLVFGCQIRSCKLETSVEISDLAYFHLTDLLVLSERRNTLQQLEKCLTLVGGQIILD